MHSMRNIGRGKMLVSAALSLGLVFAQAPAAAIAEESSTQSIQQITDEISRLYIEAEQSQYDLISTNNRLAKINELMGRLDTEIEQAAKDLEIEKANLSTFVSEDYKQGGTSLLDIILNSTSFEDFLSQVTYANKIAEHKQQTIARVDDLYSTLTTKKSELEQARIDQENYLAQQQEQAVAAEQANQAAIAFMDALPAEVVEQLQSNDAAQREAAMQASMAALSQMDEGQLASVVAAAEGAGATTTNASGSGSDAATSSDNAIAAATAAVSAATTTSSGSTSSSYSDLLSRAYSLLGSGYQWSGYNYTGDNSSSSFTCSGVVDYALGRSSQSSSPESLYEEVGSNLTTDVSSLQEGDLVFYSYGGREVGHVGVYAGNGQVIDSIPNGGVAVRDVNYMDVVGGGSIS